MADPELKDILKTADFLRKKYQTHELERLLRLYGEIFDDFSEADRALYGFSTKDKVTVIELAKKNK